MRLFLEKITGIKSKDSIAANAAKGFVVAGNASLANGDLSAAASHYKRALEIDSANASAHTNLGYVLKGLGEFDSARSSLEQAVKINPKLDDAYHMLAQLAELRGDLNAACSHLDAALVINPNSDTYWCDLCRISFVAGKVEPAKRAALLGLSRFPKTPDLHLFLGNIYFQQREYEDALNSFDRAVELVPNSCELHRIRGFALCQLKRFNDALESYAAAIHLKPDYLEAHYERGNVLQRLTRFEEALECFEKAITLFPKHVEAFYNRGICLCKLGKPEQALICYDRAISLSPDFPEAHLERGNALWKLIRLDEALKSFEHAIALNPDNERAHINRGLVMQSLMQFPEALIDFEKAIAINPESVDAHWNEGLLRLTLGDFDVGWKKYEWRRKKPEGKELDSYISLPLWLGEESLERKTILLHGEQGLGDIIQFYRYVQKVLERGAKVILVVPPTLHKLISMQKAPITTISSETQVTEVDFQCSLMSLPLAFGTKLDDIDGAAYLHADADVLDKWKNILGPGKRPRVCIIWRGNPEHGNDANRSFHLANFKNILCPDIDYFTLQFNLNEIEQQLLLSMNVKVLSKEIKDFSDTAAIIELSDLIITVDTSAAHLAGALGKKAFILLPFVPDWRWLLDRSDSPWYKSVSLFRQSRIGNWEDVFPRVKLETEKLFHNMPCRPPRGQGKA